MVQPEFTVEKGKRLDTLAYDTKERAFVIIEYKKKSKLDMVAQVDGYMNAVMRNKEKCLLELPDPKVARKSTIWKNTRMIFVKPRFKQDEIEFAFSRGSIDLCAVHKYPGGWLIHHITEHKHRGSTADERLTRQSESNWLDSKRGGNPLPETRDLYFELAKKMCDQFPKIQQVKKKAYVGLYLDGKLVCRITFSRRHLNLMYNTSKDDSLPVNDFVKLVRDARRGRHSSKLQQKSDIGRALECVGMLYQSAGHQPEFDTEDYNDRPREAGNQSVPQIVHKVIDDKLSDGKEHTLQELYSHMFKALDGMSAPEKKAQRTMRGNLTRLKNAGKIASVGRGAYKRA